MRARLAFATLRRHPLRTLLAALGVAVSAAMLLDMVMLASGMRESFRDLLDQQGFALRITPRGTIPFDTDAMIAGAGEVEAALRGIPGVTAIAPVLGASLHFPRGDRTETAFGLGIDPREQGDYELVEGRDPIDAASLVANDVLLRALGARVGDTVDVAVGYDPQLRTYAGRRRLALVGQVRFVYLSADQAAAALALPTLQAMGGAERRDRVSIFMVRAAPGSDIEAMRREIDRRVPRVTALSTEEALRLAAERLSYFRQLAFILGAVSLIVGFLLVSTLVTVSVNERVGEIAVMRAIGVSKSHVVQQVVLEGIAISLGGAFAGLLLGLATARYLNSILRAFPGLPEAIDFFVFQPRDAYQALALLVVSGVAAGIYPAWRASSLPIATTLREEAVG